MDEPDYKKDIEALTLEQFISIVKQMRFNQRRFKRTQKPETLKTLEPLEQQIDEIITLYFERQQKIF